MPRIDDPDYLRTRQYADSKNLEARIAIHRRFSTNPITWPVWVFDRYDFPEDARVLEVGCGSGAVWRKNAGRVPAGWTVHLTDFSPGMLASTRDLGFDLAVMDVMALGLADASVDAVIANHMLYHVPDRERAMAEMARVLRPGGRLIAATNGERHLQELRELTATLDAAVDMSVLRPDVGFRLQNGAEQLAPWFDRIERIDYEDGLEITEADPLVAYVLSETSPGCEEAVAQHAAALKTRIEERIARDGAFRVTKEAGVFRATLPAAPGRRPSARD